MPHVYKIRKGLNIKLKGKAEKIFVKADPAEMVAVKPTDFHLLVPKLTVKEGDTVKAGTPLFHDKNNPAIKFASPVSGIVVSINRGERRGCAFCQRQNQNRDCAGPHRTAGTDCFGQVHQRDPDRRHRLVGNALDRIN